MVVLWEIKIFIICELLFIIIRPKRSYYKWLMIQNFMAFRSEIKDDNLIITDGCDLNSLDSFVIENEGWAVFDFAYRTSANDRMVSRKSLFYMSVDSLRMFFEAHKNETAIKLRCPECESIYGFDRKSFYDTLGENPSRDVREAV